MDVLFFLLLRYLSDYYAWRSLNTHFGIHTSWRSFSKIKIGDFFSKKCFSGRWKLTPKKWKWKFFLGHFLQRFCWAHKHTHCVRLRYQQPKPKKKRKKDFWAAFGVSVTKRTTDGKKKEQRKKQKKKEKERQGTQFSRDILIFFFFCQQKEPDEKKKQLILMLLFFSGLKIG